MKILIMGFSKIKYMPYMNFYIDNLDSQKNQVHLLFWNRDLKEEKTDHLKNVTLHEFKQYQEDDVSKLSKLGNFAKYRRFAQKLIKAEQFDFIFILHSLPGILLSDVLIKNYENRYVFDYRDATYEQFAPYKKRIGALVKHSRATFVSSDGFRALLPEECAQKIHTSHNLLADSLLHRDERAKNGIPCQKIRIAFWGFIRHEQINKELIARVAADERFELHYYGREQQVALNLKNYVGEIGAQNIFFHGEYKPEDRYDFVKSTDLIHNVYFDENMMRAVSNKYYDSIIFRIPQICMPASFMGVQAQKAGIGLALDPRDEHFTEQLYQYYENLDQRAFFSCCDQELKRVYAQYEQGISVIKRSTNEVTL